MPVNERLLRLAVAKQSERVLVKEVRPFVKLDFETKKEMFLEAFDEHPVTQELNDGPNAFSRNSKLSSTGGNLFSLLGFDADQKPAVALRTYLDANVKLGRTGAGQVVGKKIRFTTPVNFPTVEEVDAAMSENSDSSLEWTSRPFTNLLSRGISGLPRYLFDISRGWGNPPSRSGTAIQVKGKLQTGSLGPIKYVGEVLGVLKRLLSNNKK